MKSFRLLIAAVYIFLMHDITFGQAHDLVMTSEIKTEKYLVQGACNMCKSRIEKTAGMEGVTKAVWNKDTGVLQLEFDPVIVQAADVLKKVAAAGHDNELFTAPDEVYNKLPACCKYERKNINRHAI